jgi:hypothetical protein
MAKEPGNELRQVAQALQGRRELGDQVGFVVTVRLATRALTLPQICSSGLR